MAQYIPKMPPKPTLDIDMAEFRAMRKLMIKVRDDAKGIRHLQDKVLPDLKQQLADATGIFKGKECKALLEQITQTEEEISRRLDVLPAIVQAEGYPDVRAFTATYRKAEAVVGQTGNRPSGSGRCRSSQKRPAPVTEKRPGAVAAVADRGQATTATQKDY